MLEPTTLYSVYNESSFAVTQNILEYLTLSWMFVVVVVIVVVLVVSHYLTINYIIIIQH